MKVCTKCKRKLPVTTKYFRPEKHNKNGLCSWCRGCCKEYRRKYDQTEKGKVAQRNYYQSKKGKTVKQKADKRYYRTLNGRLRTVYSHLNQRCNNPKSKQYQYYGGRGIQNKFKSVDEFLDYTMNVLGYDTYEKIKGLEIDRIDNNGNYEKGNIQFTTHSKNMSNRRKWGLL